MPEIKQRLMVDLAVPTGAVKKGACGFLYGLGNDGVPDRNMLAPLKPGVAAQKPPGGLQHPNGDCFEVSASFQKAGGKQIQIYLQDIYAEWPYETQDITDYLNKTELIIQAVLAHPLRELFAYVPFNEPDAIWYNDAERKEDFFRDWQTVYRQIRSRDSAGCIVGPNTTKYREDFFADFMAFCKSNECLPDIISWHELDAHFFSRWYQHFNHYRSLERALDLPEMPICINEYGCWRDLSVPGRLIQWLARLENSKVDGCLAYWHAAGNLDDLVTQNRQATGAWWLFKWYGDLTGNTVCVTPPDVAAEGLQGLAAFDEEKRQVRVILGGLQGTCDVIVKGLKAAPYFDNEVHVKVWSVSWSGYEGPSNGPIPEIEGECPVVNGEVVVTVDNMDSAAAYLLILSERVSNPADRERKPWKATYAAASAEITDCAVIEGGTAANPNRNYQSRNLRVGAIEKDTSRVEFQVDAPDSGAYTLDIFYGNGHGGMAQQLFKVDAGPWALLEYHPNLTWGFTGIKTVPLRLTKDSHRLSFAKYDVSCGRANLSVDLDKIELSFEETGSPQLYQAVYAELLGAARIHPGAGYVLLGQGNDSGVRFITHQAEHGYYRIEVGYCFASGGSASRNPAFLLEINDGSYELPCAVGAVPDEWTAIGCEVFLPAGINQVTLRSNDGEDRSELAVSGIKVSASKGSGETFEAEAPENTLSGVARVFEDAYASGGKYVGAIGNGAMNALQFKVKVAATGTYQMIVYYANAEKAGNHQYNVNIIDRYADIAVNEGMPRRVYFRNTYGWNAYRSIAVCIALHAGDNTIRFFNNEAEAPHIDKIEIAPCQRETID